MFTAFFEFNFRGNYDFSGNNFGGCCGVLGLRGTQSRKENMKKIILLLITFCVSIAYSDQGVWNGITSDLNLYTNYTGLLNPISTTDTLTCNTGSAAGTLTANLSCGAFITTTGYTGNISLSTYTLTANTGDVSFSGSGTLNLGAGITMNGTGVKNIINSTVGAITSGNAVCVWNGSTDIIYNKSGRCKQYIINAPVRIGGTNNILGKSGNTVSPLIINSTLTTTSNFSTFYNTSQCSLFVAGTNYAIDNNYVWNCYIDKSNMVFIIPKSVISNTGRIALSPGSGSISSLSYINFSDTFSTSNGVRIYNQVTPTNLIQCSFTPNKPFSCDTFQCGSLIAYTTGMLTLNYGGGENKTIYCYKGNAYTYGCTENMDSSKWIITGTGWANGSTHVMNYTGKAKHTFQNTVKSVITSAGIGFDSVVIAGNAEVIDTIADSLYCTYFNITSGKFKFGGHPLRSSGRVEFGGADSIKMILSGNSLYMTGNDSLVISTTGVKVIDSLQWSLIGSTQYKINDTMTISRLKLYPGKKYSQTGRYTLTVLNKAAGEWSGTSAARDTLSNAKIKIKNHSRDSYMYLQNDTLVGGYTDTVYNSIDGGGNVGFIFSTSGTTGKRGWSWRWWRGW